LKDVQISNPLKDVNMEAIYQQGTRKSQEYQTAQNKVTKSLKRCESANYQQDFV
jgi:hypothetical protein